VNISSGVILSNHNQVIFRAYYSLFLSLPYKNPEFSNKNPKELVEGEENCEYLTVCSQNKHCAFYSYRQKAYRLTDIKGSDVWSVKLDDDNCWPEGCLFSSSGDAVIFRYDYDRDYGLFLYDLNTNNHRFIGKSDSIIGTESSLRYFVLDNIHPNQDRNGIIYEKVPISGEVILVTPEKLNEYRKQGALVIDRQGCIIPEIKIPIHGWQGIALLNDLSGYVVLKDFNLSWYRFGFDKPEHTIEQCVKDRGKNWHRADLCVDNDQVLVECGNEAVIADRRFGVVWHGYSLQSVYLKETRILTIHDNEAVNVIRCDGTNETTVESLPGFRVLGADIYNEKLVIAYLSKLNEKVIFQTYELEHLDSSGLVPGKDIIADLARDLDNPDYIIRDNAVKTLSEIGSSKVVDSLVHGLFIQDVNIRRQAVTALSKIGDLRAVLPLTRTYLGNRHVNLLDYLPVIDSRNNTESENEFLAKAIKQFGPLMIEILVDIVNHLGRAESWYPANSKISWDVALLVLWSLSDDLSVKTVNNLIHHHDDFTRYRFAGFLGRHPEDKATEFLLNIVEDSYTLVRREAVTSLGKKKGQKVKEVIIRALSDQDEEVRKAAEEALKNL
jgi:hypothetical protein